MENECKVFALTENTLYYIFLLLYGTLPVVYFIHQTQQLIKNFSVKIKSAHTKSRLQSTDI